MPDKMDLQAQIWDSASAEDEQWIAASTLWNRLRAERMPEDPSDSPQTTRTRLLSIPSFIDHRFWIVWHPGRTEMLAYGLAMILMTGENTHITQMEIGVLPEWRRQGIGTQLLALVTELARVKGKRLLITQSWGSVPAAGDFLRRARFTVGLESHTNQLDLSDLDRAMVSEWLAKGVVRNPDIELGLWLGNYPEDDLEEIARLLQSANGAPMGDMEIEDLHWTPDQLRQQQASLHQRGDERWTLYLRDRNSNELAGFTEVFWNASKPAITMQGFTAVWPKYQNRGLGRWLKAAMLDKVTSERPEMRYVRTDNADSNAPMLKINMDLGFKPHTSEFLWQAERERVEEYLADRPA